MEVESGGEEGLRWRLRSSVVIEKQKEIRRRLGITRILFGLGLVGSYEAALSSCSTVRARIPNMRCAKTFG